MKQVTLTSPSKINLFLEVLGRRDDGYHEICSIVALTELCDTIILERRTSGLPSGSEIPRSPQGQTICAIGRPICCCDTVGFTVG